MTTEHHPDLLDHVIPHMDSIAEISGLPTYTMLVETLRHIARYPTTKEESALLALTANTAVYKIPERK